MTEINDEYLKLMYDRVYDELNRGRDWPIKIMAFASAAYLGLFSIVKLDKDKLPVTCSMKIFLTGLLLILLIWTIKVIITQHINYLKYRDIQIKLQKMMSIYDWEIDDQKVFPESWKNPIVISMKSGFYGWGFYACYMVIISLITLALIWGL